MKSTYVAVAVSALAFSFSLLLLAKVIGGQDYTNHTVCVAINNLNKTITQQLRRSQTNLPKLAYYHEHPDELRDQEKEITNALEQFRPRVCQ